MAQKIRLGPDGILTSKRMIPHSPKQAHRSPSVGLSRLQKLLSTGSPEVCIVRGEGLGDVLMTTPTVHALKTMFKQIRITYATNTRYLEGALVNVLKYNPDIDCILERDLLDDNDYDLVVNLHCPAIHYEKPTNPPINRIDLFAKHAGVKLIDTLPKYYIRQHEISAGEDLLRIIHDKKKILVQPFASNPRRSIDHRKLKEALIELYQNYGIHNVVLKNSSDFASDVLWENLPGSIMLNDLNVREIAGVMVHCDLVLCPDSSILHLAAALKTPTVSVFFNTHPAARVNHYPNTVAIWRGEGMVSCPCWFGACPTNYACKEAVSKNDLVEACLTHLSNTTRTDILELSQGYKITIETEII